MGSAGGFLPMLGQKPVCLRLWTEVRLPRKHSGSGSLPPPEVLGVPSAPLRSGDGHRQAAPPTSATSASRLWLYGRTSAALREARVARPAAALLPQP